MDLTILDRSDTAALVAPSLLPVAEAVVAVARHFLRFLVDVASALRAVWDTSLASRDVLATEDRLVRRDSRLNFDHDEEAADRVERRAVVASSISCGALDMVRNRRGIQ